MLQKFYIENCAKVKLLNEEYKELYKRYVQQKSDEKVTQDIAAGKLFIVHKQSESEDAQSENSGSNKQFNTQINVEKSKITAGTEAAKFMIEHRKDGLNKVTNLMSGIRDLGFEFNEKVEMQGEVLAQVDNNLEEVNENTKKGSQELSKFAQAMKGKGMYVVIFLIVLVLFLFFLLFLIFDGN